MEDQSRVSAPALNSVFPPDGRVRVDPTTVTPFSWVGQLAITFPDGSRGTGTGTLIDRDRVLTCGHNLYQDRRGGRASSVIFSLAQNGTDRPYPPVGFRDAHVSEEYRTLSPADPAATSGVVRDYSRYLYDFGVVSLQTGLDPAEGAFPFLYDASDETLVDRTADIAGYPGDKTAGTMWNAAGPLTPPPAAEFLWYRISTFNGQSGAAVRCTFEEDEEGDVPRIVGIHVAGSSELQSNFAVRLTSDVIRTIETWL